MTGIEALQALREGKVERIHRNGHGDMTICIDEERKLSLSVEYDEYIQNEFAFDLRFGSPGAIVEHFYNDLLNDDWEVVK